MEAVDYVLKIFERHPIAITLFAFGLVIEKYLDKENE